MFDILFKGECQPQQNLETVKQNMAQLFKISAEKAEALFNGQSRTLKSGLEKEIASKYIQAISRAGAIAYAVESDAVPESAVEQAVEDAHTSVLEAELDPPGTTLLTHEVVQPPDIDIAQLSLSQPGETLAETADVPDADIEISHLSLSESGSHLADK
ncbi:MAG TPA: hypothetical protein ENI64_04570 [Gammaproteobacteria bacterium]|nr:hypothetical protein [Gammaproteobacteria bacterium]